MTEKGNGLFEVALRSPLSSVVTVNNREMSKQIFVQFGQRFLETIEAELEAFKDDLEG